MENEIIIRLIPLKIKDSKVISCNENTNALQQLKVSNKTTLYTISHYIHRLSTSNNQSKTVVLLYTAYSDKFVEIPLSMTAYHYLLITGEKEIGEIRYSFIDKDEYNNRAKQFPPVQFIIKQTHSEDDTVNSSSISKIQYPDPIFSLPSLNSNINFSQTSLLGDLSFTNLMNQSIHPELMSFSLGYQNSSSSEANKPESEEIQDKESNSISLRHNLEQILRK